MGKSAERCWGRGAISPHTVVFFLCSVLEKENKAAISRHWEEQSGRAQSRRSHRHPHGRRRFFSVWRRRRRRRRRGGGGEQAEQTAAARVVVS